MVSRTPRRNSSVTLSRRRPHVWLLLLSLSLFGVLAVAVNTDGPVVHADSRIALEVSAHVTPRRSHLAELIFTVGNPGVLIPLTIVAAILIAWWRQSVLRGVLIVAAVGVACAFSGAVKELLPSQRPAGWAGQLHAFPSTHTTATATLFGVVAVVAFLHGNEQNWALLAATIGACAVGAATVVFRAHWPSDVVGGLLVATTAVATVRLILIDRSPGP